jgi:hypothetical protein
MRQHLSVLAEYNIPNGKPRTSLSALSKEGDACGKGRARETPKSAGQTYLLSSECANGLACSDSLYCGTIVDDEASCSAESDPTMRGCAIGSRCLPRKGPAYLGLVRGAFRARRISTATANAISHRASARLSAEGWRMEARQSMQTLKARVIREGKMRAVTARRRRARIDSGETAKSGVSVTRPWFELEGKHTLSLAGFRQALGLAFGVALFFPLTCTQNSSDSDISAQELAQIERSDSSECYDRLTCSMHQTCARAVDDGQPVRRMNQARSRRSARQERFATAA